MQADVPEHGCRHLAGHLGKREIMADSYTIKDGDTLSSIASSHAFTDNGEALKAANPTLGKLTGNNFQVLPVGITIEIPDKRQKHVDKSTDITHPVEVAKLPTRLLVTLYDEKGVRFGNDAGENWGWELDADGKLIQDGMLQNGEVNVTKDLRVYEKSRELKLKLYTEYPAYPSLQDTINLHLGELDPIVQTGERGIKAIQKMLSNLGFYIGEIDGKFGPKSKTALRHFKNSHNLPNNDIADEAACAKLIQVQGNTMAPPKAPEKATIQPEKEKLPGEGPDTRVIKKSVTLLSEYEEPTDWSPITGSLTDPTAPRPIRKSLGRFQDFPKEAYVATYTDDGSRSMNPNNLQKRKKEFIMLDVGCFYSTHQTFGLIYGRRVYLCEYSSGKFKDNGVPVGQIPEYLARLDQQFFGSMNSRVGVIKHDEADWAPDSDFNETLYLIIPDMHLMNEETGKIWHGKLYERNVEMEFLNFAILLCQLPPDLISRMKIINIGDAYDLWIGCPEYFEVKDPEERKVIVGIGNISESIIEKIPIIGRLYEIFDEGITDIYREVRKAIYSIHGIESEKLETITAIKAKIEAIKKPIYGEQDMNSGVAGLGMIESTFGGITYLYGNHDNVLIDPEVTAAAGLAPRVPYITDIPGLFIEHVHRLEASFSEPLTPKNYDGTNTGFIAANLAYFGKQFSLLTPLVNWSFDRADDQAREHDQPQYLSEYAQMWLGRASLNLPTPHIFVIGHTHIPNIFRRKIKT